MKGAIFDGIDGVDGKVPFGAIVSTGTKGDRGNPVNTDRFYISATAFEEIRNGGKGYRNLRHPLDPRFDPFNKLGNKDRRASVLRGNLVFPERDDCLNYHLLAQQLSANGKHGDTPHGGGTWETPPRGMPACTGDGVKAERYDGLGGEGKPRFIEINCPNKLCPFRTGQKKVCGAFGRLYFRLRWPEGTQGAIAQRNGDPLPSILVRYQTHGWATVENMLGLFQAVEEVARGLGMARDAWTYSGLPFEMSVGMKHQPDQGRRFPVVSFGAEDIPAFLRWQAEQRQFLIDAPRSVALIGDGMSHEEGSREGLAEALDQVTPGYGIPATVEPPVEGEVIDAEAVPVEPETQPEPEPEAVAEAAAAVESHYRIAKDDPRDPYDRLREFAVDALGLQEVDLHNAAKRAAGCDPRAVTIMFEAQVAAELEHTAAEREGGE